MTNFTLSSNDIINLLLSNFCWSARFWKVCRSSRGCYVSSLLFADSSNFTSAHTFACSAISSLENIWLHTGHLVSKLNGFLHVLLSVIITGVSVRSFSGALATIYVIWRCFRYTHYTLHCRWIDVLLGRRKRRLFIKSSYHKIVRKMEKITSIVELLSYETAM